MTSRKSSYRRNRDYSKSFKWTYDLDKDLYECFTKSKSDPRIGFINQMKQFWDEKHPELSSFTSRNLRDYVSGIIKRMVVMKTDFDLQNQNIEQTNTDNSDTTINDNTLSMTLQDQIIEQITPEVPNVKVGIREQFKINFETTLTANLKDRQINRKLNKKLDKNIIIAVSDIAKEILESIESRNYHDINCLIYTTAVTCKAYIQDFANQKESNALPKLLHHLQQSVNRVRKELNHINLLIKWKKENSHNKHQKELLYKYWKKLGNTTLTLFEYKRTILKQEVKGKSEN